MAITLLEFVNRIGWEVDQAEFDSAINNVGKAVDKLKGPIGRLNLVVSAAFTALTTLSVKAASDAVEVQNKFNQTFGEMADTANTFADEFASSLNKSDTAVKDSMSSFQAFTVGLGFGQEEALGMSQKLQELTTDFGSFNNLSDTESQQRFISAMSGSSEVVDRFGINLKQANLDLKLQELGLAESAMKADEMQKAVARLAIIEESMGRQGAVGDAIRTLGDFASTMRGVRNTITRVAESFGELILPIANVIGKGFIVLLKVLDAIPAPLKAIILLLGLFLTITTNAAVAMLLFVGAAITMNTWLINSGINLSILSARQLVNIGILKLQQFWTTAVAIATGLYTAVTSSAAIATVASAVSMKLANIGAWLLSGGLYSVATAVTVATAGISLIIPLIVGVIVGIVAAVKALKRGTFEVGKFGEMFKSAFVLIKAFFTILMFFPKLIYNVFDALSDILLTFLDPVIDFFNELYRPIFEALKKIEERFGGLEEFLFEVTVRMLIPLAEFQTAIGEWSKNSIAKFTEFFDGIKKAISTFVNSPSGKIFKELTGFGEGITGSPVIDIASKMMDPNQIAGAASNMMDPNQIFDFMITMLNPQRRFATAGSAPLTQSQNRVNMTNEITNTIEIRNGMSAGQAEDVIVSANRRSMQQMANDALRNTSGAD